MPIFSRTKTLGIQLSAQRRKIAVIGAKGGSKALQTVKRMNHQICCPTLMETPGASGKSIQASSLWYCCCRCAQEGNALTGWPIAVAPLEHVIRLSLPRVTFTLLRDGWRCDAEQVEQYEVLTTAKRILDWKPSLTDSAQQLFDLWEIPTYRPQFVNGTLQPFSRSTSPK